MDKRQRILEAFGKIDDSLGMRLSLTPKELKETSLLSLIKRFNNPKLMLTEIDNYHGPRTKSYICHSKLQNLNTKGAKPILIKTAAKDSGYKALHLQFGELELQIKSERMTDFGNWEHKVKYKPGEVLGRYYKHLSQKNKGILNDYLKDYYKYISDLDDNKKKITIPKFPQGLPKPLEYKYTMLKEA